MKTLILALGNPILSDDGVGWEVADRLAERLNNVDIIKESTATMDLIPMLTGYDRVVIIDAIQLGSVPVGTVHRFSLDDFVSTIRYSCPHDINFATAFKMAAQFGYDIPDDVQIYAIEAGELLQFAEGCTDRLAEKLDKITDQIANDLNVTAH